MSQKEAARKATWTGAIAAVVSGVATLAISSYAVLTNASGAMAMFNDPWNIAGAFLILLCAYGIYKKSRTAAVVLLGMHVAAWMARDIGTGQVHGVLPGLVFGYFFANAALGAFAFHNYEKLENPGYQPAPRWTYWVGYSIVGILVLTALFGVMEMSGVSTPTDVQPGSALRASFREELVANKVIHQDDVVVYYYSNDNFSIVKSGSILTDDRVIRYGLDGEGMMQVYEIPFADITSVELLTEGGPVSDSVYLIDSTTTDTWMKLPLSVQDQGDVKFVKALRARWVAARDKVPEPVTTP